MRSPLKEENLEHSRGLGSNKQYKKLIIKNGGSYTNCKSEINDTQIDSAKDIDIVMPMYNLMEYSDNSC